MRHRGFRRSSARTSPLRRAAQRRVCPTGIRKTWPAHDGAVARNLPSPAGTLRPLFEPATGRAEKSSAPAEILSHQNLQGQQSPDLRAPSADQRSGLSNAVHFRGPEQEGTAPLYRVETPRRPCPRQRISACSALAGAEPGASCLPQPGIHAAGTRTNGWDSTPFRERLRDSPRAALAGLFAGTGEDFRTPKDRMRSPRRGQAPAACDCRLACARSSPSSPGRLVHERNHRNAQQTGIS